MAQLETIHLPIQEMWVQFLGQEDPLEEEMQPTPVFLPGKFNRPKSLVGYSPRGCKRVGYVLATKQQQQQGAVIELDARSSFFFFFFDHTACEI